MIIASLTQFHAGRPWGQRLNTCLALALCLKCESGSSRFQPAEGPSRGLFRDYEPSDGPSFESLVLITELLGKLNTNHFMSNMNLEL